MDAARWIAFTSDPLRHALGITPTTPQVIVFSVLLSALYYALTQSVYTTRKARAWLLTFQSSTLMSISALFFVSQWYFTASQSAVEAVEAVDAATALSTERILMSQTPLSAQMCTYFAVYLAVDLVVGVCWYREHIHPLTGWIHHIGYSMCDV